MSCELKNSFLCPPNYEVVSCVLKITSFCALRIKEQFIVPSESQNSLLCPPNNGTASPPYSGTAFCALWLKETVSCSLQLSKEFIASSESRNNFLCLSNHDWSRAVCSTDFSYVLIWVGHELVLILMYWLQGTNRPPRHIHIQETFVLTRSKISVRKMIGYTEYGTHG